jgi:hypothetical protein
LITSKIEVPRLFELLYYFVRSVAKLSRWSLITAGLSSLTPLLLVMGSTTMMSIVTYHTLGCFGSKQ